MASRLAELGPYARIAWEAAAGGLVTPLLHGDRYRTILAVQMDALAALLQAGDPAPVAGSGDAREVLIEHETRYWSRVADRFEITLTPAARRCLVTAATLWEATTRDEGHRLLLPMLGHASSDTVANVADWLATLYGGQAGTGLGCNPTCSRSTSPPRA